jgi:hypothetical protein
MFYQVTASHDANLMRIVFPRAVIYDWVAVCEFLALSSDMSYFVMSHHEHCISTLLSSLVVALCHASKIFARCCLPHLACS